MISQLLGLEHKFTDPPTQLKSLTTKINSLLDSEICSTLQLSELSKAILAEFNLRAQAMLVKSLTNYHKKKFLD